MHVRWCDCDDCLPASPASPTAVVPTEPAETPIWRRRLSDDWKSALEVGECIAEQFTDPEARKRAENAMAYQKRKLAQALDV